MASERNKGQRQAPTADRSERNAQRPELEAQNEELRRTQLELQEQREKYRELFDLAPVGYVALDDAGVVCSANLTAARLLVVARQGLIGRQFSTMVFKPDREAFREHHGLLRHSGWPRTCELRLQPEGAEPFWASLEWRRQDATNGEPLRCLLAFTDVHEKVLAEEAQRESAENFRAFFDAVDDIVGVATPEGQLIHVNAALTAKLGYAAADLTGITVFDLYPPERRAEAEAIFAAMSRGERDSCSLPVQARSGALLPVETRVWSGRWDGAPCIFGVSRDLTTEEETLRRFDRLFAGSPSLMALTSFPESRFTDVNDAFLDALGYVREEVIGHTPGELDLFVAPEQSRAAAEQLQADGRIAGRELKVRCKDGSVLDGLFSGELIGRPGRQYLLTAMIDQAELKQAESALAASEERLRRLFETMTEGVILFAADGRIISANLAAENALGLTRPRNRERAYDSPAWDVRRPDGSPLPEEEAPAVIATREKRTAKDVVVSFTQPDGALSWFSINAAPLLDKAGELEGVVTSFSDITERVRAEGALQESEQNFRAFFDAVDDVIVVGTLDGRIVYANPAVSAKLGYSAEELAGMSVLGLNPTDRRAEAEAIFAAMLAGERESCPLPLQSKSGALIPVETRVWFGRWDGEECVFGVSKDLTTEQEALQKFESLFRGNPAPMAVSSLSEGLLLDVNSAFLSTLGFSREDVLGRTFAELGLFAEPGQQRAAAEDPRRHGRIGARELKVRSKDGTILDGLFFGEIIESQGQSFALTVMVDQTGRKRAEHALRESEEKHRNLREESPDPLFSLTPEGRYKYVNRAFAEGTCMPAADIIGRTMWDVFSKEEADKRFAALSRVFATGAGEVIEVRVPRADGDRYYMTTITPIADAAGRAVSAHCSSRDVTALKRAEQNLLESFSAQQAVTEGVIAALARTVEARDPYTAGHQQRVGELAAAMALEMGLGDERAEGLHVAGILHDVGKITVPAEILAKPGLLAPTEFDLIKGHAQAGYDILAAIRFPWPVAAVALQHHERQDGSGYPAGLAGEEILPEARILAVADVVEAMASHRPYRAALGLEAALAEVRAGAGTRFDADVVAACEGVFAEGFVFSES